MTRSSLLLTPRKKTRRKKSKKNWKTKNKPAVKPVFRPSLLLTLRSTESCHATPASSSSSSNIYYMSFIMEYCNVLSKISRKAKQTTNNWYWIANLVDWAKCWTVWVSRFHLSAIVSFECCDNLFLCVLDHFSYHLLDTQFVDHFPHLLLDGLLLLVLVWTAVSLFVWVTSIS